MRWLLALLILTLAACAAELRPAGPPIQAPALAGEALTMADGTALPLHAWASEGTPRGVLLTLHGFNDSAPNFMAEAGPRFAEAGWQVYAYDQRGFGATPQRGYWVGGETLARDAVAAVALLRARHPGLPLVVLGESMGAAVAIRAATSDPPPRVDAYVLLAPALWARETMNPVLRGALWFFVHTMPALRVQGGVEGIRASDNDDALRRLSRHPLTIRATRIDAAGGLVDMMDETVAALPRCCGAPLLVLFGAQDQIVPKRAARRMLRRLPGGPAQRIAYYENGYHLLLADNQREVVATDILAWLADPAAPLPSGADAAGRAWMAVEE